MPEQAQQSNATGSETLQDKVVVITGGGRGIGRAIALACADAGAKVVVMSRTASEIEETCEAIRKRVSDGASHGNDNSKANTGALAVTCDVTNPGELAAAHDTVVEKMGSPFGLILCAGIYGPIERFDRLDFAAWRKSVEINLIGTAATIHAFLPDMRARESGRVVLMSGGGQAAMPNFSSYTTSKGGIWRLTENLGAELAPMNIYVNAIAPGAVNTSFLDYLLEQGEARVGKEIYARSLQQKEQGGVSPQQACDLILYLLSPQAAGLHGKVLSARWDPYQEFNDTQALSNSDLYTMKRVVNEDGGTRV